MLFLSTLVVGVVIRMSNWDRLDNQYPLGLDPYYFLRQSSELEMNGKITANDTLRYYPKGFDTSNENLMVSQITVLLYRIISTFNPDITVAQTLLLYPVIMYAIGQIAFFLLAVVLFNRWIALGASFLFSVLPSYLYRTMAGFADKEPVGLALFYIALLFISIKSDNKILRFIFFCIAGISTGLMGLSWGGVRFLLLIIPLFFILKFLTMKIQISDVYNYFGWIIFYTFIMSLTPRYGGPIGLLSSIQTGMPVLIGLLIITYITFEYLIKQNIIPSSFTWLKSKSSLKFLHKLDALKYCLLIGSMVVIVIAIFKYDLLINILAQVFENIIHPVETGRLMLTVAESRQPYFVEWLSDYNWFIFVFMAAVIIHFHNNFSAKSLSHIPLVVISFAVFGIFFSRISPGSMLDGETITSKIILLSSIILLILYFVLLGYNKKKISTTSLLLLAWMVLSLISARGAIRLFIMVAPVVALYTSYLASLLIKYIIKSKDKVYKYSAIGLFIILFILPAYSFAIQSYGRASSTGPSFNTQWQEAMEFVRTTPEDSVFAHWWDYGYWVQTEGQRATILDGGNWMGYWNHLLARHVLCGRNSTEALEFLAAHNATHVLIISDEIRKYTAYSSIGADDNYDIFSWIATFQLASNNIKSEKPKDGGNTRYTYPYYGGTYLDEDITVNGKIYPANKAQVAGFLIITNENEITQEIDVVEAQAIIIGNDRVQLPIDCIYKDDQKIILNQTGQKLGGCLKLMPNYLDGNYQQPYGTMMYISRKGLNTNWAKMYILDEDLPGFKLAYDDSPKNPLFYYNGNIYGPLKIWEVEYPKDFSVDPEIIESYLDDTNPEWMNLSQTSPFEVK
ncbi:hypothetical protein K9M79_06600 [Candidatus Woesearchaeota archaeon]|nr:hypothetical protein [Candidatus Woesearchaeota archaeon]